MTDIQTELIDFPSFLRMTGNDQLIDLIERVAQISPIPRSAAARLSHLVRIHMATGSIRKVVLTWIETHDLAKVDQELDTIIASMVATSASHLDLDISSCKELWKHIPRHVAREHTNFRQSDRREASSGILLDPLLLYLSEVGILKIVRRIERPSADPAPYVYQSQYKYYLNDTGLFRRLACLPASTVDEEKPSLSRFRGTLTESYILNSLTGLCGESVWYWKSGNQAEVDFIISIDRTIIPVEVKTARNVKSHSLAVYRKLYQPQLALRYSLLNLKADDELINIPIHMAWATSSLVGLFTSGRTP